MASNVNTLMTWAAYEAPLKAYLGVTGTSEDASLQLWLAAMTESVDMYLEATYTTLPSTIVLAVYIAIATMRERQASGGGLRSASTKDLSEAYMFSFASDAALASCRALLRPYKTNRELDGGSPAGTGGVFA